MYSHVENTSLTQSCTNKGDIGQSNQFNTLSFIWRFQESDRSYICILGVSSLALDFGFVVIIHSINSPRKQDVSNKFYLKSKSINK